MESWKIAQSIVGTSDGRPIDDFYPTPSEVTKALLSVERFPAVILEPACGDGAISRVLEECGYKVYSSDLYDHGYGQIGIDFLGDHYKAIPNQYQLGLITNPPFKLLEGFIRKSMELNFIKIAMFAKLSALEGKSRSELLENTLLKNVWIFKKRVTLTRNGEPSRNGGMIAFAWYVWEKNYKGKPTIGWI
jgi:hypothetical protein